jgi:hypothetical protein
VVRIIHCNCKSQLTQLSQCNNRQSKQWVWGFKIRRKFLAFICVSIFLQACSPAPRRNLSAFEKKTDLDWFVSQLEENYAPLRYKCKEYGFDWEAMKNHYYEEVRATKTNEAFYRVIARFIAEFKDGHLSAVLLSSGLPNRTKLAYLGFDGERSGSNLVVREILPTEARDPKYPIFVGDEISKLNGKPLPEILREEFIPYRNLGQDESNLTALMPKIFNRYSLFEEMPTELFAELTVVRDDVEMPNPVRLPWVVKDLYSFTREQQEAAAQKKSKKSGEEEDEFVLPDFNFFQIASELLIEQRKISPEFLKWILPSHAEFDYRNSFVFLDSTPTWGSHT